MDGTGRSIPQAPPIRVMLENRLPADSAIHDRIDCDGIFRAEFAGQEIALTDAPMPANSKTVYYAGDPLQFATRSNSISLSGWYTEFRYTLSFESENLSTN